MTVRLAVQVPHALGSLAISQADALRRLGRWLGVIGDVPTGDARLDDKYVLSGPASALREAFRTGELEGEIDQLFRGYGLDRVELAQGELRAQERLQVDHSFPRHMERLFQALLRVARLLERSPVDVSVLGPARHFALGDGAGHARCPYCRDDLRLEGDDLTACPACRTVHHRACFAEGGGCTVFGCREAGRRRGRERG
jgi:hypothetical protein